MAAKVVKTGGLSIAVMVAAPMSAAVMILRAVIVIPNTVHTVSPANQVIRLIALTAHAIILL